MRLIVARCEVRYFGRLETVLPKAVRLLMLKADGTFMVWADGGRPNIKPINWMTPPTIVEEERNAKGRLSRLTVRHHGAEERLEVTISRVFRDLQHDVDALRPLRKQDLEREIQELLAEDPTWCGEGLRLIRREWQTDIGPVDLMCRDVQDRWVAIEVKRMGTMDSVRQLSRYLTRIRRDPAMIPCRGILAAKLIRPQAHVLAKSEGITCVEVDVEVMRGARPPELTLFE